jgi:hypothetical protein
MDSKPGLKPNCPCTDTCDRHGNCKECKAYHQDRSDTPFCKNGQSKQGEGTMNAAPGQIQGHDHSLGHGHSHGHHEGHIHHGHHNN